jgi:hypothetical protein
MALAAEATLCGNSDVECETSPCIVRLGLYTLLVYEKVEFIECNSYTYIVTCIPIVRQRLDKRIPSTHIHATIGTYF